MRPTRSTDETDNIYGDLVVESRLPTKHGKAMWSCYCQACDTGGHAVSGTSLRNGSATHCGCKTTRDVPTTLELQARIDQLEARLAALEGKHVQLGTAATPAILANTLIGAATAPPAPPPPAAKNNGIPEVSCTLEDSFVNLDRILNLPFKERTDVAGLLKEALPYLKRVEDLLLDEDLRRAVETGQSMSEISPNRARLDALRRKYKQFHLDPKDL